MNGNRQGVDPAKIFILGMFVVVLGLAVVIVLTHFSVKRYEEKFADASRSHFKRLAEAVEIAKKFRAKEGDETIDLENPINYFNDKARSANIQPTFQYQKGQKDNSRKGYSDVTYTLNLTEEVSRLDLVTFLHNIEKGSSILRVAGISEFKRDRKTRAANEDFWRAKIVLAYRKAYVKPTRR